uniref:Uncharacterized protein n=1 Tax=Knipowitschia caucasica TaxID=637954 RepID=A0AAV2MBH3_KNICA
MATGREARHRPTAGMLLIQRMTAAHRILDKVRNNGMRHVDKGKDKQSRVRAFASMNSLKHAFTRDQWTVISDDHNTTRILCLHATLRVLLIHQSGDSMRKKNKSAASFQFAEIYERTKAESLRVCAQREFGRVEIYDTAFGS